ncbi:MAG: hypothetical protein J7M34_11025 [Anaerolineae bacterium]|nr:hypothetical protein [Anaerolineae bacterium]
MDTAIVACAQQRLRLHASLEDYRHDCVRFLRMAQSKGASLVVLPELSGVMAAVPRLPGVRASLLRQADQGRRRGASLWRRAKARVAGSTAELLRVDFRGALARHLAEEGNALRQDVEKLFSELARSYGVHIIVGAGYLPGDGPGQRSLALAFSPQGELIGEIARVGVLPDEEGMIAPGEGWDILDTPVGRIGVLMGKDVLYPETARLLAYRGADILVVMAATSDAALAAQIRATALARAQENQIFVLTSFLIGNDPLREGEAQFTGRSAIMAPAAMTSRNSGVLVQMGTSRAEGLITAELNFYALRDLWQRSGLSARSGLPLTLAGQALVTDYTLGRSLDEAWEDVEASRKRQLLLPEPSMPPAVSVTELPAAGEGETAAPLTAEESGEKPVQGGGPSGVSEVSAELTPEISSSDVSVPQDEEREDRSVESPSVAEEEITPAEELPAESNDQQALDGEGGAG